MFHPGPPIRPRFLSLEMTRPADVARRLPGPGEGFPLPAMSPHGPASKSTRRRRHATILLPRMANRRREVAGRGPSSAAAWSTIAGRRHFILFLRNPNSGARRVRRRGRSQSPLSSARRDPAGPSADHASSNRLLRSSQPAQRGDPFHSPSGSRWRSLSPWALPPRGPNAWSAAGAFVVTIRRAIVTKHLTYGQGATRHLRVAVHGRSRRRPARPAGQHTLVPRASSSPQMFSPNRSGLPADGATLLRTWGSSTVRLRPSSAARCSLRPG